MTIKTKIQCKKCSKLYTKVTKSILTPKGRSIRLQRVNGRRWSENVGCPHCDGYYLKKTINTACNSCSIKLPPNRFTLCKSCEVNLRVGYVEI